MKSCNFDYACPTELGEVFDLLERHGDDARILAGGQSLMPTLNMRLSDPALLIDINRIVALKGIELIGETLRIGALTRHVELERSSVIAEHAPLLRTAIGFVAHPAIRNRGTIGGSLSLADPAAELPACMLVLGASIVLRGRAGQRRVPVEEFFIDLYETARADGEILEAVELPSAVEGSRYGFDEVSRRHGDFAMAGLAARVDLNEGSISDLRLGFLGIGNTPVLSKAADKARGRSLDADTIQSVKEAVRHDLEPNDDLQSTAGMKIHLASVLTGRVLRSMME